MFNKKESKKNCNVEALKVLLAINVPQLLVSFLEVSRFWKEEDYNKELLKWVSINFPFVSEDPLTLAVYSLATNKSIDVLREALAYKNSMNIKR